MTKAALKSILPGLLACTAASVAVCASVLGAAPSYADTLGAASTRLDAPLPANTYITANGLDWAWAAPVSAEFTGASYAPLPSTLDLSYQGAFGWRLPTAAELLIAPAATAFLFAGANVPYGGSDPISGAYFGEFDVAPSDGACAAPYFNTSQTYSHCDWTNGRGQSRGIDWAKPGENFASEQLVVRAAAATAVPEPASFALLATGLLGLGALGRRRKHAGG